ncbi:MAG: tetratricopeptide repeat protein [Gammaproteobacteria bacterium]|nr:tetratricopeptide repeat protein [Gammaproteobacteria bacterium]
MTQFKLLPLYAALLLVTACTQPSVKATQPDAVATQTAADAAAEEAAKVAKAKAEAALPKQPLTPDILFKFLVAEVAGQRGALGVAQPAYMDLARQTRDPRIARRAAEISMFSRNQAEALEAARLWAAAEPDSERAQQTVVGLLLNEGKLDEAEPILRSLLKQDPANVFLQMSALMGKLTDHQAALAMTGRLAADYPALPEAHFAVAQAAAHGGRLDLALAELKQADTLRPGWEPAALMHAQILAKTALTDALAFMRAFLVTYPDAREVRLAYARSLVSANQIAEARAEFTRLTQEMPRNAEVTLAAGLLALQVGDLEVARGLLADTLEFEPRDPDMVQYYLGQVAEQMKQPEAAARHYGEVKTGNYLVPARARQARLLVQAGKPDEAQALLAFTHGENEAQSLRLIQAQAELLGESKRYTQAFETLSDGIKRYPNAPDLYYDRAMVAEKLGKLDLLEKDLRRVIALRPDNAQAYNALGYTLADRTNRLAESITLLDKALSLAPNDAYILDSVGWAQYRAGNLTKAQDYLERAYRLRPDPEIAAHLGEVLWARGQRDEAGKLWQTSLQTHPQNEVLLETLRRLKP